MLVCVWEMYNLTSQAGHATETEETKLKNNISEQKKKKKVFVLMSLKKLN